MTVPGTPEVNTEKRSASVNCVPLSARFAGRGSNIRDTGPFPLARGPWQARQFAPNNFSPAARALSVAASGLGRERSESLNCSRTAITAAEAPAGRGGGWGDWARAGRGSTSGECSVELQPNESDSKLRRSMTKNANGICREDRPIDELYSKLCTLALGLLGCVTVLLPTSAFAAPADRDVELVATVRLDLDLAEPGARPAGVPLPELVFRLSAGEKTVRFLGGTSRQRRGVLPHLVPEWTKRLRSLGQPANRDSMASELLDLVMQLEQVLRDLDPAVKTPHSNPFALLGVTGTWSFSPAPDGTTSAGQPTWKVFGSAPPGPVQTSRGLPAERYRLRSLDISGSVQKSPVNQPEQSRLGEFRLRVVAAWTTKRERRVDAQIHVILSQQRPQPQEQ